MSECITDVWFWCKKCKIFLGRGTDPSLSGEGDNPSPHPLGASILTPPILKFCLCYWLRPKLLKKLAPATWRTPHWYEMCFANDQATFDHACIKTTVHTVPGGIRTVPPGHIPPIQFPLDNFPSHCTRCKTSSFHPPIYNIKQCPINVYKIDRRSGVRVNASFQIFALTAGWEMS